MRLPRDWLGPREELVPVGRPTPASTASPFADDGLPPTAEAFWSEDSAALHDAVQSPTVSAPSPWPPAGSRPGRYAALQARVLTLWQRRPLHAWPHRRWAWLTAAVAALLLLAVIGLSEGPTSATPARQSASAHNHFDAASIGPSSQANAQRVASAREAAKAAAGAAAAHRVVNRSRSGSRGRRPRAVSHAARHATQASSPAFDLAGQHPGSIPRTDVRVSLVRGFRRLGRRHLPYRDDTGIRRQLDDSVQPPGHNLNPPTRVRRKGNARTRQFPRLMKASLMTKVLGHLKSNAVAYLALFVALGGTGYAATNLPRGSVGTNQLKNHSVTPIKFDRGSIAGYVRDYIQISAQGQILSSRPGASLVGWQTVAPFPGGLIQWNQPIAPSCFALATTEIQNERLVRQRPAREYRHEEGRRHVCPICPPPASASTSRSSVRRADVSRSCAGVWEREWRGQGN